MAHYSVMPDFTKQLTIVVGDEAQTPTTFTVSQDLLVAKSNYFEAASRNDWKEAATSTIKLPDVDVATFRAYLVWVHKGEVAVVAKLFPDNPDLFFHAKDAQPALLEFAKLWLLGDRFGDTKLRNTAVDEMVTLINRIYLYESVAAHAFLPETIGFIYSATTAGRPLRRLLVDYFTHAVYGKDVVPRMSTFHPEFIADLLTMTMHVAKEHVRVLSPYTEARREPCRYHEHNEQHNRDQCPVSQPLSPPSGWDLP